MDIVVNPKLNKSELINLFEKINRDMDMDELDNLRKGLKKSYVIAAYENKKLIGMVRALSDYSTLVYIQDLIIVPEYRGLRVGKTLMHHLLNYFGAIEQVVVSPLINTEDEKFYRYLGFYPGSDRGLETYLVDHRAK
ncbi:GNAT family N-acetyltransferase [Ligilactobacillus sp. WILCCON 0076]|uniref:GNAT family N-acetyltransferase n=1 Tax=Ligilactobacillus ubinensis TaxID=2876789 RepID=A0A9X2FNU6_9LACO|nr:GNAT family N-acetyltransferase [Ligilactobacillus ubinensis]MCP0887238.1 GNAT family N-acetyltransferase [Ligilactobacillus ubinensis]